jgi:urease accessory protein
MRDWTLWQLIDSAFPTGGFAHSNGLEATWQQGEIGDTDSLTAFLRASIHQAATAAMPLVIATLRKPADFGELDALYDATVTNHIANRASRAQGRALLLAASGTFAKSNLTKLEQDVRSSHLPSHLAPVFGVIAASLGISEETTAQAFLFILLRGSISAAVRLGIIGPMEAQRVQTELSEEFPIAIARSIDVDPAAVVQTAPLTDLLQANQGRLYSRLFQS